MGLFRSKKREDYLPLLKAVVSSLSSKYSYLLPQITNEFILGVAPNPTGEKDCFTLSLNSNMENRFLKSNLPGFFILQNILIWNKSTQSYSAIELDIVSGILSGYKLHGDLNDLDLTKIDSSSLKEKYFGNSDRDELRSILGETGREIEALLEIDSTFRIDLPEGVFYTVKDFKDGNYLAIKKDGSVYALIHDPYQLILFFERKEDFFIAVQKGEFDLKDVADSIKRTKK